MGWSRRAGSEEAGDGAATARWRRRWQRGEGARQDATNEVETNWSVDNDNAQVSRVDLPSAASGVRPTRLAGGCRVHSYVPQREWREQERLRRLMTHAVGPM